MPGKAAKVTVTERQHEILLTLRNATTAPSHLRQRAAVILLAFDGLRNEEIADRVGLGRCQVGRWRRRWAKAWSGPHRPRVPRDQGRPAPGHRSAAHRRSPPRSPRQVHPGAGHPDPGGGLRAPREVGPAHHPLDGLRAGRRGRQAGHRRVDLDDPGGSLPPRGRPAAPQEPVLAQHDREGPGAVSGAGRGGLRHVPRGAALERTWNTHTVCVDEMTGIQALERIAPAKPMIAGSRRGSSSSTSDTGR